jgi:hypothetical protein
MDTPSGTKDLIADAEQSVAEQERLLKAAKAKLARRRKAGDGVITVDADGTVVDDEDDETSAEIARREEAEVLESDWAYDVIEYKGEQWNVRRPTPQAITMFTISTGKYVPETTQRDIISLFLVRHMSPKSFVRLNERMIDGDDPDFNDKSMGEMMRKISTLGTARPIGRSRA